MKGISVARLNGKVLCVNVVDECGNGPFQYTVEEYVDKGYKPDWRTLPDETT